MSIRLHVVGKTFNRLEVLRDEKGILLCRCVCGNVKQIKKILVTQGKVKSCGCLWREHRSFGSITHGKSKTSEYHIWSAMIQRCYNPNQKHYKNYGGRGISVCERWRNSFEAFLQDVGPRPGPAYSLDRYPDNDGNYEPGNVRWATDKEQSGNRRGLRPVTINGEVMLTSEAARRLSLSQANINQRIASGWDPQAAITTPSREVIMDFMRSGGYSALEEELTLLTSFADYAIPILEDLGIFIDFDMGFWWIMRQIQIGRDRKKSA